MAISRLEEFVRSATDDVTVYLVLEDSTLASQSQNEAAGWLEAAEAQVLFLSAFAAMVLARGRDHDFPAPGSSSYRDPSVSEGSLYAVWDSDYYRWILHVEPRPDGNAVVLLERR